MAQTGRVVCTIFFVSGLNTLVSGIVATTIVMSFVLCMVHLVLSLVHVLILFFVFQTIPIVQIQTSIGDRLPIVQGGSFAVSWNSLTC